MTTAYTSLLGLALPVTGELSGTWGTTVNNYITQYLDAAVAGAQTISGTQTAVTLTTTNGLSLTQAGAAGGTGSAQYAIINCTGNPAGLLTITAPAASKAYLVLNSTSTSQSVKVVGAGPTTGVTVATGQAALIAWNGSDFTLVATTDLSKLSGVLTVAKGGTGATTLTGYVKGSGTSALTASATIPTSDLTGTLPVANGGTNGTATPTAGTVAYGTGAAYAFTSVGSAGQVLQSNGAGAPTWANASVGSVTSVSGTGTVNGISLTGTVTSSGNLTLGGSLSGVSLTSQVTGTLPVANGGTNGTGTPTAGAVAYGTGTAYAFTSAGSAGQVLQSNGAGAPTWANAATGTVTSVSGTGTINGITLTGTVTSSGSLTLGGALSGVSLTSQVTGTLPAANGGTGNVNGTVAKLATTNFSIEESGGKLLIKYGATTLLSINSSGNVITIGNITAAGTP